MAESTEKERVTQLVIRLRRLSDDLVIKQGEAMTIRNSAVAMQDAAASLVDHVLDGEEPRDG
jgi:hypothetical protein